MKPVETKDNVITVGYPEIKVVKRKRDIALRIFGAISIGTSLLVAMINFITYNEYPELWSLIVIGSLLYVWLLFNQVFMSKHFYSTKTLRQVISVSIILILIDIFTGYSKWALTYVIPFVLAGTTLLLPIIVASMPEKYFLHVRSLLLLIIFDLFVGIIPFVTDWMVTDVLWTGMMSATVGITLLAIMFIFARKTTYTELVKIFRI